MIETRPSIVPQCQYAALFVDGTFCFVKPNHCVIDLPSEYGWVPISNTRDFFSIQVYSSCHRSNWEELLARTIFSVFTQISHELLFLVVLPQPADDPRYQGNNPCGGQRRGSPNPECATHLHFCRRKWLYNLHRPRRVACFYYTGYRTLDHLL